MIKFSDIYNNILTEARWRDVAERYRHNYDDSAEDYYKNYNQGNHFDSFDELVSYFREQDPTDNSKYLQFFLEKSLKGRGHTSSSFLIGLVNDFHRLSEKGYIKNKDIYSKEYRSNGFGLEAFEAIYTATSRGKNIERTKEEEKRKAKQMREEGDVVYEDSRWKLVSPKTYKASCHFGMGTKWCTTSKDSDTYFKQYTNKGILIYFIDKTKTREDDDVMYRIALNWQWRSNYHGQIVPMNISSSMWYDAQDNTINPNHIIPLFPNGIMTAINDYYQNVIDEMNVEYNEMVRVRKEKQDAIDNEPAEEGITYWRARNSSSTFKFKYPPREGSMTQRLVDSIEEEPGITKKEFYDKYGIEYRRGHNTQFFSSIKDAGIIRVEKGPYGQFKYYLGPNYEVWKNGTLKVSKNYRNQTPWNR